MLLIAFLLMALSMCSALRPIELQRRFGKTGTRRLCTSSSTAPLVVQQWEEKLETMESNKLYGLGSKEVELDQVISWLRKNKLNLFPEYQRDFVWKPERASRLVVTVLCNRLMPAILLHEKEKGCYEVVDGKQRLCSLLTWYLTSSDPSLLNKKKLPEFDKLSKLDEDYSDLDGLSFRDLTDTRQKAFESYCITYLIIPFGTDPADVFEVYSDINSGERRRVRRVLRYTLYTIHYTLFTIHYSLAYESKKHASPLEAAQFELEEEAQLQTKTWIPLLADTIPLDKYSTNLFFPYLALDCTPVAHPKPADEEEYIRIEKNVSYQQLMSYISNGEVNIISSFTIMLALQKLDELRYPLV